MKNLNTPMDDELRPEYDLQSLRVRKVGLGRKNFNSVKVDSKNPDSTELAEKNDFEQSSEFENTQKK